MRSPDDLRADRGSLCRACLALSAWALLVAFIGTPSWGQTAANDNGLLGIPGCRDTTLQAVDLGSADDGWAVGFHEGSVPISPVALRWDGRHWASQRMPDVPAETILYGVEVASASLAWAVGSYREGSDVRTATLHWNGHHWKQVPSPSPDPSSSELYGVAVVSATDAWAAGRSGPHTLVERWDGVKWTPIAAPSPGTSAYLRDVTALSATDVWAVGGSDSGAIALHWDGTAWTAVQTPSPGKQASLNSVTASWPNDVWTSGAFETDYQPKRRTLTEHWDGATWSRVKSANVSHSYNELRGIDALTAIDVWAVGAYSLSGVARPLVEHWDGASWSVSPVEEPRSRASFYGVDAIAHDDAWAVGERRTSDHALLCLVEHWDGAFWEPFHGSPN